jgi:hypothetical protein
MNRWYVYRETSGRSYLFDLIQKLGGGNVTTVAAEYRKDHPRLPPDSLRFTDKKPEGLTQGVPMPYVVLCKIEPTAKNMLKGPWTTRIGAYYTRERAQLAIAEDLDQCGETFGGLIPPTSTKDRTYRVWRADRWTDVTAGEDKDAEALAIAREACAQQAAAEGSDPNNPHSTAALYRSGKWDETGLMPSTLRGVRAAMGLA